MDEYFFPGNGKGVNRKFAASERGRTGGTLKEVPVWYRWCVCVKKILSSRWEDVFFVSGKVFAEGFSPGHQTHRGRRSL